MSNETISYLPNVSLDLCIDSRAGKRSQYIYCIYIYTPALALLVTHPFSVVDGVDRAEVRRPPPNVDVAAGVGT